MAGTTKTLGTPVSIKNVSTSTETGSPNSEILEAYNIVNSVKRKLNQSASPGSIEQTELSAVKVSKVVISPDRKRQKPAGKRQSRLASKRRGKQKPADPISSQDSILIDNDDEYNTEDEEPLAGLTQQSKQESDSIATLVRTRRFRKTLQRRGTPKKTNVHAETAVSVTTPQQLMIPDEFVKMVNAIQSDISSLKLGQEKTNASVQLLTNKTEKVTQEMVTKEHIDESINRGLKVLNDKIEKQDIEINRHKGVLTSIEENITAMQVSMEANEGKLREHDQKMDKCVNEISTVRAEKHSEIDELKRQFHELQKKETLAGEQAYRTYAKVVADPAPQIKSSATPGMERSIILDGVIEFPNEDLDSILFQIAQEMRLPLREWEISCIERLGFPRADRVWPRPIRVEFVAVRKQQFFLANRGNVFQTQNYFKVRIRADEPRDTRIAKAKLRKLVRSARMEGRRVWGQKDDEVYIDGSRITKHNVDEFLGNPQGQNSQPNARLSASSTYGRFGDTSSYQLTKRGLAFYGAKNRLSSFYPCNIRIGDRSVGTLEHGYQSDKALDVNDMVRYREILAAPTPGLAKYIGSKVQTSLDWNIKKPHVMRKWQYAKYRQNPELADFICSTAEYPLIEASQKDDWWGAGAGLNSRQLEDGTWDGRNELGTQIEVVRGTLLKERGPTIHTRPGQVDQAEGRQSPPLPHIDLVLPAVLSCKQTVQCPPCRPLIVDITPQSKNATPLQSKDGHSLLM